MKPTNVRQMLDQDEGNRLVAYPDPLTGGSPWTIGRGHTGPEVYPGLVWTQLQSDQAFDADIARAVDDVRGALPWVIKLNDPRQAVLYGMRFQMGLRGLLAFKRALAAAEQGQWALCRAELQNSKWAKQTTNRCYRRSEQMETGEWR